MNECKPTGAVGFRLHHIGIVVADLDQAATWYCEAFGLTVAWREPWTDPDSDAMGLPGGRVRLRGAGLPTAHGDATAYIELHQFSDPTSARPTRRTCDLGYGHLALHVDDLTGQVERLRELGMSFHSGINEITSGPLAGALWLYGADPWGNVVELLNWAAVDVGR